MAITVGADGYCVLADVEALNPHRSYSSSTIPTDTQVEDFITDYFHILNGVLDVLGITTPVESSYTKSIRVMKKLNAYAAAAEAERATASAHGMEESAHAESLWATFQNLLKLLQGGMLALEDAPRGDDARAREDERTPKGEFNLDDDGDENDPVFTRDWSP